MEHIFKYSGRDEMYLYDPNHPDRLRWYDAVRSFLVCKEYKDNSEYEKHTCGFSIYVRNYRTLDINTPLLKLQNQISIIDDDKQVQITRIFEDNFFLDKRRLDFTVECTSKDFAETVLTLLTVAT